MRNSLRVSAPIIALILAIASVGIMAGQQIDKPIKKRFMDQITVLPDKNFNTRVRTVIWPVGYKSKPHTHGGPGPRYVIKGKVEINDSGVIGQYSAGDAFWHAGGIEHTAENIADEPSEVLIIELLPLE